MTRWIVLGTASLILYTEPTASPSFKQWIEQQRQCSMRSYGWRGLHVLTPFLRLPLNPRASNAKLVGWHKNGRPPLKCSGYGVAMVYVVHFTNRAPMECRDRTIFPILNQNIKSFELSSQLIFIQHIIIVCNYLYAQTLCVECFHSWLKTIVGTARWQLRRGSFRLRHTSLYPSDIPPSLLVFRLHEHSFAVAVLQ